MIISDRRRRCEAPQVDLYFDNKKSLSLTRPYQGERFFVIEVEVNLGRFAAPSAIANDHGLLCNRAPRLSRTRVCECPGPAPRATIGIRTGSAGGGDAEGIGRLAKFRDDRPGSKCRA